MDCMDASWSSMVWKSSSHPLMTLHLPPHGTMTNSLSLHESFTCRKNSSKADSPWACTKTSRISASLEARSASKRMHKSKTTSSYCSCQDSLQSSPLSATAVNCYENANMRLDEITQPTHKHREKGTRAASLRIPCSIH